MPLESWNDQRLDGLERRVDRVEPVTTEVAVIKAEMRNLSRELKHNTLAVEQVGEQLEKAQLEPLTRSKNMRSQMVIAISAAVTGGGLAILGGFLASH